MRLPHRLGRELDAWQREGLIGDDQRRVILARYEPAIAASALVSNTLIALAVLAAGTGIVVFLSWNWSAIPPLVKTSGAFIAVGACYAAAAMKARAGKGARSFCPRHRWTNPAVPRPTAASRNAAAHQGMNAR